jgi:hypothetical protein
MLARFQAAGGKVEWIELTDTKCTGIFSHAQGGSVSITWDMARAKQAELSTGKDNWRKYPRQMLRARVVSEGVRTVYPGVCVGVYTPEEVEDFDAQKKRPTRETTAEVIAPPKAQEPDRSLWIDRSLYLHDEGLEKAANEYCQKAWQKNFDDLDESQRATISGHWDKFVEKLKAGK